MMKRISFLAYANLALIAVLFVVLPMFANSSGNPEAIRCDACHVAEKDEFSRTVVHKTLECRDCHTVSDFAPDLYSHNATTFECIYCHAEQGSQVYRDAHLSFSNASYASDILTGNNELCNSCHSGMELEMEWHAYNGTHIAVSTANRGWDINFTLFGETVSNNYANYTSQRGP